FRGVAAGKYAGYAAEPGGPPPAPVRMYFPEVGYWNPSIVTDAQGKGSVTFKVPDTATQWRLTLRGVTPETLAGQTTANVVTRKEFFVELKVPSILMEGDRPRMIARVHNLSDIEGEAELRLRTTIDGKTTSTPKTIKISKGVTEAIFDAFEVPAAKQISFELVARAADSAAAVDAVSQTVPVRPWGLVYRGGTSGTANSDETLWTGLPTGRKYSNLDMTIFIGTTLERALIDIALDGVGPIVREQAFRSSILPPDTTTSPASSLIGVLSCLDYVRTTVGEGAPDVRRLRQKAESHISELAVSQRDDGGWSWAGRGGDSDPKASAMALWALGQARKMGFIVPDKTMVTATGYLQNAFASARQTDNEGKVVILYALSFVDKADFTYANRLYRERNALSEAALAYLTLTLDALERPAIANEVLDVLISKAKPVTIQSRDTLKWSGGRNQAWIRNDIETTALTLLAMAKVRPDAPQLKQGIEWLMSQRHGTGWLPYRAKGPALAAVCSYYGKAAKVKNDYMLRIAVNEKEIKSVRVEKGGDTVVVEVPSELLKPEGNKVTFDMEGTGEYSYVVAMTGFSTEMQHERRDKFYVDNRYYMPPSPEYKGRAVQTGFSVCRNYRFFRNIITQVGQGSVAIVEVDLQRSYDDRTPEENDYLILEESIPSGTTVLANSISGNFAYYTLGDGRITFYFGNRPHLGNVRYQLYGYLPGEYRVLPSVLRSAYDPTQLRVGPQAAITVLAAGEKSTDKYRATPDELYYLGKAHFDDGDCKSAASLLARLYDEKEWELRDEFLKETARMLLHAAIEAGEPKEIVKYFEVLKEKYPELFIPFDKILAVGRAYRQLEEHERAYLVFRATAEAGFVKDSNVAGTLQGEGKFLPSVEYMTDLWREYPDTPSTESTYFALSQAVYAKAGEVLTNEELKKANLTKADVILRAIEMLNTFLTLYPKNPANDDASFSLVNAFLELEGYDEVVKLSQRFQNKFTESEFFDSFIYTEAIARFSLSEYNRAIELCQKVAEMKVKDASGVEQESKNKWLALYMIGQIYHAQGKPKDAIESYQKVKDRFSDAKEAIEYFEQKGLSFEDVSTFLPNEKPEIELTYRNIPEVDIKAYKVDLMKLFLQEKNLSRITGIRLAGIAPTHEETIQLGDGKDYEDKKRKIALPVKEEGAYLILARGDNLHASGFVLISPLKMNVQEDAVSGRVRVNLIDRVAAAYVNKADVKVIGSQSGQFVSGETDLRGVFIADGIRGMAAVIARDKDRRYAFHRGATPLAIVEQRRGKETLGQFLVTSGDWASNLMEGNIELQRRNVGQLDAFYGQ
ncbi:MAG: alpha-2-macroglobulin family protein, partial [bacterium]|nr:alpha-2-macroglobulin family protein [bacterium]